ncbi:MAG: single-stranded DNA-binding protein [Chloroflexi bacterium RBG_16_51_9]|nr:MAG: single-stranded DNA-binding protein [Chloroflexi bacterium RBG_16_51_9]
MPSVNKIIIIGNLGKDPEMRFTPNGNPVTSFSVATSQRYTTSAGEQREETEWFTVVAWNKLAEQCNQYLSKGQLVYVEGRLHSRTWDGQDGQKHFVNEIVAATVRFLSSKQGSAPLPGGKAAGGEDGSGEELGPDDIPF